MAQPYATYKQNVGLENGQTLGFRKGKGYFAKGQPTDPFATFNEPTIAAKVKQIVGRLPAPQTNQQIQTQAQGMLDPVVQQITSSINARAQAGGQAVGGYTDQLAKNLMGAQGSVDSAYAPAEQGTAAANAALADRLSGAGNATSDALAARLASIGSPGVSGAAAGAVRQAGTGAGNAVYATGSASLEQLLGNHASASDYAGKLPDLARLAGVQQMGAVQGQAQRSIADQTAQVTSQLPGIVQNLRSQSDTRANNRASLGSDVFQFLTGQNTTRATAKAGLVGDAASLASQDARSQASIDAQNARTSAQIEAQNARTQAQIDAADRRAQLAAATKQKGGTLTVKQKTDLKRAAVKQAEVFYYGIPPKKHYDSTNGTWIDQPGTGTPGVDWPTAVKQIQAQFGLDHAGAVQVANLYYKPGEDGRPKTAVKPKGGSDFKNADLTPPKK